MVPTSVKTCCQAVIAAAALLFAHGAMAVQPAASDSTAARPVTVLVVGASGMIGSRIAQEAASRGHQVIGAARSPEKIPRHANIRATKLDATDRAAFTALAREADVIVSATSPRGGGDPMQEARAVGDAAIAVASATGRRLFVVGGAGSLYLPTGKPVFDTLPERVRGEAGAMRAVLDSLKASDVNWTFLCPATSIAPGERTGKYQIGATTLLSDAQGKSRISAEDFAHALINEIEKPTHIRSQMTVAY